MIIQLAIIVSLLVGVSAAILREPTAKPRSQVQRQIEFAAELNRKEALEK